MANITAKNVITSSSIAVTNNTDTNENVMRPEMISAIDNAFTMRFVGRPLAKVETKVVPAFCKAAEKALTAAGNIAVRLGVACLKAGERARNGDLARNGLEGAKARKEDSIETSQG